VSVTSLAFVAILLTLAAVFGFLNIRILRLPNSIGVLVLALATSLLTVRVDPVINGVPVREVAQHLLGLVDLPAALMQGVLSLLLFAGALHVDVEQLWRLKWNVLALAVLGTLIAVVLLGGGMWVVFAALGHPIDFAWCLVLGAIMAPTDPVSVTGLLRRIGLPPGLQAVFAGEALFNDGVGVVLFGVALNVALGVAGPFTLSSVAIEIAVEALGGAAVGLVAGGVALQMIRPIDEYNLELTISLALATGAYALANAMHVSGPIASVVAGLIMGSQSGRKAMSDITHQHLASFWSLIDELLNALLFLVIGLQVVAVSLSTTNLLAVLAIIPLTLLVRAISVIAPTILLNLRRPNLIGAVAVLTWGGLRGGISVALALALPDTPARATILTVCYSVVVFSNVVQGLTMRPLALRFFRPT
jgi:CPA1 family monovalent cation:H+ antiporter